MGRRHRGQDPEQTTVTNPAPRRRVGTWGKWLVLIVSLAGLCLAAPALVASSGLRHLLVGFLVPELAGKIHIGSARLSWWSPVELSDIVLWDSEQQKIIQVARFAIEKSLGQILWNPRQLGMIEITSPEVQLVLRQNGSNLQDLLALYSRTYSQATASQAGHPRDPASDMRLKMSHGRLRIEDQVTQQVVQLTDVHLLYQPSAADTSLITLQLEGRIDDPQKPGEFTGDLSVKPPANWSAEDLGSGKAQFQSKRFPLAILKPLLARLAPDLELHGLLSNQLHVQWNREAGRPVLRAAGQVEVRQPRLRSPAWLGTDCVEDQQVSIHFDGWIEQSFLHVEKLELESSLAQGTARGSGPLSAFQDFHMDRFLTDPDGTHTFSFQGNLDLPKLSQALRNTLRLQSDVSIEEGLLSVDVATEAVGGVRAFKGRLTTDKLIGQASGKSISWTEPVAIRWDLASSLQGTRLRELHCASEFLQIDGRGDLQGGEFRADANLASLAENLRRFVDLGSTQLTGRLNCQGTWTASGDTCTGECHGTLQQFAVDLAGHRWREEKLELSANGVARVQGPSLSGIDQFQIQLQSGTDHAQMRLTEPVALSSSSQACPLDVQLSGRVESWLARLQPFLAIPQMKAQGEIQLAARGSYSASVIVADHSKWEFTNLQYQSPSIQLSEPKVILEGPVTWDQRAKRLQSDQWTLASSTCAARGKNLIIACGGPSPEWSGEAAFRGDLARVAAVFRNTHSAKTLPAGRFEGTGRLRGDDKLWQMQTKLRATPLSLVTRQDAGPRGPGGWSTLWQEDQLDLQLEATYSAPENALKIVSSRLNGTGFLIDGRGTLRTSDLFADLEGEYEYDLGTLGRKLQPMLGNTISAAGKQRHKFRVRGPLIAQITPNSRRNIPTAASGLPAGPPSGEGIYEAHLTADFGFGWDQIQAYGISLGPKVVQAKIDRGVLDLAPVQLELYGGRIELDSRIDFTAQPASFVLDQPAAMEGIQLTPSMCRAWLKYVAPLLAEATSAQGSLSIHVHQARVPLTQPSLATVQGRIIMDRVQVTPGPLAQQFLGIFSELTLLTGKDAPLGGLLDPNQTWLSAQQQQIDFQMAQGRIYHRNLELKLRDTTIRTEGSVGLDQTLSLVAEVPIQDKWLGQQRLLEGLRGQTIKIPIQGSLQRPAMDRSALAKLTHDAVGSAAERVLQDELQKGLQKLFGPR